MTTPSSKTSPTFAPARRLALPLALVGALAVVVAAAAQTPGVFTPGGDLDVYVAGKLDPAARLYESTADAAVLVLSDRLPSPVLLHVRSRGVQAVPQARIKEAAGQVTLERGDPLTSLGTFEVVMGDVTFWHGSVEVVLRPKPSLVGARTLPELFAHTPKYRSDAAAYRPDPAVIAKLREVGGDYRVKVVFGSWCHVCKQFLPRGLAVAQALEGAALEFEYFGLPIEEPWSSPEVKRLGVTSLPTAIVYRGDREIGRFAGGEQWEKPEVRLWQAISAGGN